MRVRIRERVELRYARSQGQGVFPNIAGLAVPVYDANGVTVAALSVAAPIDRINDERLPLIVEMLRREADAVIDTSALNVHQLRRRIITEFTLDHATRLSLLFESFAYKRGVPAEADFVATWPS
ncbi:hypothetical protein G6F24_016297 [Rhizopus arrhizus]|nr:hypothetical protein G6F24_016297 [Rhizopus arrhizus]